MNNNLFRKKSIDKVSSPEQLNEYLRAVTPGMWIAVAALLVFLAGFCAWCIFGSIETRVPAVVVCRDGESICYTSAEKYDSPEKGMTVAVGENRGVIISSEKTVPSVIGNDDGDAYLIFRSGMEKGEFCYETEARVEGLADGVYEARVIYESVSPIEFVFRSKP